MSRQRSMEKILESEYVSIGELVRLTNSRYSTLKFYTEEGMLPFNQEEENLTRRFPRERAMERIEEIKILKRQGHRIDEIKKILMDKDNI
ncbi:MULTISPECIES: helix-turn-helix domain-containing protein [Clostridium]|uniref:MerR HTH family regulatory protein n=1 Tax=Clostridium cadaveris TaxID=1529 RepID=A0A1I2NIW6_9CLOT|nr:helix-turn-helix domain-containing protein [Clostridium cadaveris]MDU4952554.1 helix-turn-helix domain-containing protein [Clostridium sp.]MDM8312242.1 helix-turn-helix domain-containing protein [Clostridium cadaveris]NME65505.1 MerR family transcriptional regulator [Clostridium cadaveris]NWK11924.1 MerR family transcriptional regulator [Clostridium cadaveris]PWL53687.1 MAG: MerR family DNA-binding transcriptional regulator [Clostridium cadaveris]